MKRLVMLIVAGILVVPGAAWCYNEPWGPPIRSAPGVKLYQSGSDYVLVAQVNQGARVTLPHGAVSSGVEGYRPLERRSIQSYWDELDDSPLAFAVTNGTFFAGTLPDAGVAFPLKVNGNTIAFGYANTCWLGHLKILKIWDNRFRIEDFNGDPNVVINSTAPNIIGGLAENTNCATTTEGGCSGETQCKGGSTQRTFVGCADHIGNGDYRTLLVLTTSSSNTGSEAGNILRSFGAGPVMMLDGGGSTQMICQGTTFLPGDGRLINTAIGVLAADNTPPNPPSNVTANPLGCAETNNFSFSWSVATDPSPSSGIKGYYWRVNTGGETFTPSLIVPGGTYATQIGTNTFYVRAEDNAGNFSGYAQATFCWQPPSGPNLSFENDADVNGIPDSWTHVPINGGTFSYPSGGAVDGSRYVSFTHTNESQWNAIGTPASSLITAGTVYRLDFWYRTTSTSLFSWRLGASNIAAASLPINCTVSSPLSDGQWHHFWSAPFSVSSTDLANFPNLAFYYDYGTIGTVDTDWVNVIPTSPCP